MSIIWSTLLTFVLIMPDIAIATVTCPSLFNSDPVGTKSSFSLNLYQRELSERPTSGKLIGIEVTDDVAIPVIETSNFKRTLKLPTHYSENHSREEFENYYRQLLVGNRFHPYIGTEGQTKVLRRVQTEGLQAAIKARLNGARKFLYVAPTATGKTEVLIRVLDDALSGGKSELHLVIADRNHLVGQLAEDLKSGLQNRHHLIRWGGTQGSGSLGEIVRRATGRSGPTVLVTTIQSLTARFADDYGSHPSETQIANLLSVLSTVSYDEAHHMGAVQAKALIKLLIDSPSSRTFLMGTTATPLHKSSAIEQLFDGHGFWAYLDTANSYLQKIEGQEMRMSRPLESILDQLGRAIDAGELTPFDDFLILQPKRLTEARQERWRIDEEKTFF